MHNPLLGPVTSYGWDSQPGYGLHQGRSQPLEDLRTPFQDLSLVDRSPGAGRAVSSGPSNPIVGTRSSGATATGELPEDSYTSAEYYLGKAPTRNRDDDYQYPTKSTSSSSRQYSFSELHSGSSSQPTSKSTSDTPASDSSGSSDRDSPHSKSLTITDEGEFLLGPQWTVPDAEAAQDLAGCNTERVIVKSTHYSPEHKTRFTLTERIDNCDVVMSGGLSVGVVEMPPLPPPPGRGEDCFSLSSCWSRPQSPGYADDDAELPPARPSSQAGLLREKSNDGPDRRHYRSISEVLSSPLLGNYEGVSEIKFPERNEYHQSHGHMDLYDHQHHDYDYDYDYDLESPGDVKEQQQTRVLRRKKGFHKGSVQDLK